eukprot:sb/3462174/
MLLTRSDLVRSSSKNVLLEYLARSNSLNKTGALDYNKLGQKDGVGLCSVTNVFVDNFLVSLLVPDYNMDDGKFTYVGTVNKSIRELLTSVGIAGCVVKAIGCKECKNRDPDTAVLFPVQDAVVEKYYVQEFKVACPNINFGKVMEFLRAKSLQKIGLTLKDIDFTIDYAGSFNKNEVITHLVDNCGFRMQGDFGTSSRTIVDNDRMVGNNCLTYLETVSGFKTRQKVYNKMVQSLECQSVRSNTGCHWRDWVVQNDTCLANARDQCSERGFTRAEVTFYIDEDHTIPDDDIIQETLDAIVRNIPADLVYSTPFASVWEVYCNTFNHSLICVEGDLALLVYTYNEITDKIAGQFIENYERKRLWVLRNNTFNGIIPIDEIIVTPTDKGKINVICNRYFKSDGGSTQFTTRLVSNKGVYCWSNNTDLEVAEMVRKAGLLPHKNCYPVVANKGANANSRVSMELELVDQPKVILRPTRKRATIPTEDFEKLLFEEVDRIEAVRRPLFLALGIRKDKIATIERYQKQRDLAALGRLDQLDQGSYNVVTALHFPNTQFGAKFQLLLETPSGLQKVWTNWALTKELEALKEDRTDLFDNESRYMLVLEGYLGSLVVRGKALNQHRHFTVYCSFLPNSISSLAPDPETPEPLDFVPTPMTAVSREELFPYSECGTLSDFCVGTLHKIESIGWVIHYAKKKLLIKVSGKWYRAGVDLEGKVDSITNSSYFRIDKHFRNQSSKIKEAKVTIIQKGEWHLTTDYKKAKLLVPDGTTKIIDVKEVDVKGTKRKLLFSDKGHIYKLKKSKLENTVKPGFV